ncbi:MAG TPA: hypothetical protein VFT69_19250 [Pseudolabrys sp.]|jgi:hypothetical protein|nr:hypothetical protein [Pseudolabrys sp.]
MDTKHHSKHDARNARSRVVSREEHREAIARWVFWTMFTAGTACALIWKLFFSNAAV